MGCEGGRGEGDVKNKGRQCRIHWNHHTIAPYIFFLIFIAQISALNAFQKKIYFFSYLNQIQIGRIDQNGRERPREEGRQLLASPFLSFMQDALPPFPSNFCHTKKSPTHIRPDKDNVNNFRYNMKFKRNSNFI